MKSRSFEFSAWQVEDRFAAWAEVRFTLSAEWSRQQIRPLMRWCRDNTQGNTAVAHVIGTEDNTMYAIRCEKPEDATLVALRWVQQ